MGDLIVLAHRRPPTAGRLEPVVDASFYFDLACPFSYLAAERVERLFGEVEWVPVAGTELREGRRVPRLDDLCLRAERQARALRLALSWPEEFTDGFPTALRAAAHAADAGAGARFALAAMRLAFCGGFDLEDPGVIADAAAAAGLDANATLQAMQDPAWDAALHEAAERLSAGGVKRLPATSIDGRWFAGEAALGEAVAFRRDAAARPAARELASGA